MRVVVGVPPRSPATNPPPPARRRFAAVPTSALHTGCAASTAPQVPQERAQAEQMLRVFGTSTEYVTHCKVRRWRRWRRLIRARGSG